MSRTRGIVAFVGVLGLLVAAGCDALAGPSPSPTAVPTAASGIQGRVIIGPTCAVEPAPSDQPEPSESPEESVGTGPSFDPDVTPEPAPSMDPGATDEPEPTAFASACYQPYMATLVITDDRDDSARARITTGEDGTFRVDLPPGDYNVVPQNGDPFPIAQPLDVTVVAGDYATIEINYDSGIR